MPDVWSEIMSARLARREVTRRHADAAMGRIAPAPAAAPTPAPAPVKEIKPEPRVTEEAVEEEITAPAPKTSKKSSGSTTEG